MTVAKKFAVIGNPIAHSRSPEIHQAFGKQTGIELSYERILAPLDQFDIIVRDFFAQGGNGLNITLPFKELAYSICTPTDRALAAQAVNTLWMNGDALIGDNTDGAGLAQDLQRLGWLKYCNRILILGAGGATRGVILPLFQAGVKEIEIANRTIDRANDLAEILYTTSAVLERLVSEGLIDKSKVAEILQYKKYKSTINENDLTITNYDDFSKIPIKSNDLKNISGHFDLIINATSASLSGEGIVLPDNLTFNYAYEMAYGKPSSFIDQAKQRGVPTADGLGMLIGQAAEAFYVWNGVRPDLTNFVL